MRFDDMVLSTERIGGRDPAYAQHDADMAHEIACPVAAWHMRQGHFTSGCFNDCVCSGTGRVTLGALVAADRARAAALLAEGKARAEAVARGLRTAAANEFPPNWVPPTTTASP